MNNDDYIKTPRVHVENPTQSLSDILKFVNPKKLLDSENAERKSQEKK